MMAAEIWVTVGPVSELREGATQGLEVIWYNKREEHSCYRKKTIIY